MIKGRFYAGLTPDMMNRSRVVNRQETNFFWPDESNAPPIPSHVKRRNSNATSSPLPVTNNNETNDIKPRELFQKQLSSGIEFYDNVDAKTPEARRRRFKKIDNVNLNNNDSQYQPQKKKLETFSSKIEFYDFVDEPKVNKSANQRETQSKPIKTTEAQKKIEDEVKKAKESPDLNKKRITFRTEEKTKSILKNVDEKPLIETNPAKNAPKRGLLPKSLSKSVDNMSKLAKIIDDVSTINADDKNTEKLSKIISEVKDLKLNDERKPKNRIDNDRDEYDSNYRSTKRYDYDRESPRRNNYEREYEQRYESRYNDRDRYEKDYDHRDHSNYQKGKMNRMLYADEPKDDYDDRKYRPKYYEERSSPNRTKYSPEYNRNDYDDYDRQRKPTNYRREPSPRTRKYEERQSFNRASSEVPPYENGSRVHRHLRSNISLGGSVVHQMNRPISVRNSAVTRVGVGLPDYE